MRILSLAALVALAALASWSLFADDAVVVAGRAAPVAAVAPALTAPAVPLAPPAVATTTSAARPAPAPEAPRGATEVETAPVPASPPERVLPVDMRLGGVVLDAQGRPVAEASVEAAPLRTGPAMARGLTDAQGRFELVLGVDRAPSVVRVRAAGHAAALAEVPYHAVVAGADQVTRERPSLRVELPAIVLPDAVAVTLRVRSSLGVPLPAEVTIEDDARGANASRLTAGRDGVLRLDLPPGRFGVRATAREHAALETTVEVVQGSADGAVVELVLVRGEVLRGRAVDDRGRTVPRGTRVFLVDPGRRPGARPPSRRCKADGAFEFESVAPGSYDVFVSGDDLAGLGSVTVSPGAAGHVEVRALPATRVAGRVTCLGRTGAWGQLRLRHVRLGELAGRDVGVLPDGTYAADELLPGEWTASFREVEGGPWRSVTFVVAPGEDAPRDLRFE